MQHGGRKARCIIGGVLMMTFVQGCASTEQSNREDAKQDVPPAQHTEVPSKFKIGDPTLQRHKMQFTLVWKQIEGGYGYMPLDNHFDYRDLTPLLTLYQLAARLVELDNITVYRTMPESSLWQLSPNEFEELHQAVIRLEAAKSD